MMKKSQNRKSNNKISLKDYLLLGTFFIGVVFVISVCQIYRDVIVSIVKDSNLNTSQGIIFESNEKQLPNSETMFVIKANPNQINSKVISLRLGIKNATITKFSADPDFLSIGTCENGLIYTSDKVCVDLGYKNGVINKGQKIGEIKLRFGTDNTFSVITNKENGFYNGEEVSLSGGVLLVSNDFSILPITGGTELNSINFTNYPLFVGISILILVSGTGGFIYLIFKKKLKKSKDSLAKSVTIIGVVILFVGSILITGNLNYKNTSPTNLNALSGKKALTDLPYITSILCPQDISIVGTTVNYNYLNNFKNLHCANSLNTTTKHPNILVHTNSGYYPPNCFSCTNCREDIYGNVVSCDNPNSPSKPTTNSYNIGLLENQWAYSSDEIQTEFLPASASECSDDKALRNTIGVNQSIHCGSYLKIDGYNNIAVQTRDYTNPVPLCYICENCQENVDGTTVKCGGGPCSVNCLTNPCQNENPNTYCTMNDNAGLATCTRRCLPRIGAGLACKTSIENQCINGYSCVNDICVKDNSSSTQTTEVVDKNTLDPVEDKTQADKTISVSSNCSILKSGNSWGGAGYYCSTSPLGYLINCNKDGGAGNNSPVLCSNGCEIMPVGQSDRCKTNSTSNGETTNPGENNNYQTSSSQTDVTSKITCGKTGCLYDSDCEGYIDNKTEGSATCAEVVGNDPSKQTCTKICKYGFVDNNACSCASSAPSTEIDCGPMDVNSDKILNYTDLYDFIRVYNKTCKNEPSSSWTCGGQDSNNDKIINYKDEYALVSNYYPSVSDCSGMPGGK